MTETLELIHGVSILRDALNLPSKLTATELSECKKEAQGIGDAVYYNAGWYAGEPGRGKLPGTASSDRLITRIHMLSNKIFDNMKPKRSRGRPKKEDLDQDYIQTLMLVSLAPAEQKRELVRFSLDNGYLKDKVKIKNGVRCTTTFEAHIKQVDRELAKLAKRRAAREPNNILIFRPKKKPRR